MEPVQSLGSSVAEFYNGTNVFLTGATGYLGKLIIEKLLRASPPAKIYILVRCKKGKNEEERFKEIFDVPVYDILRDIYPNYRERVILVTGDCVKPNLGISEADRQMLIDNVHIIFHCAATVRFDQILRTATYINIRAAGDLINMAKQMPNLKCFMHISTAYSHCVRRDVVDEIHYEPRITPDQLFKLLDTFDDNKIAELTPAILGEWPNTYSFTKCVAEDLVVKQARDLPAVLFRPSIVISTYKEPMPGWIDNFYGPMGVSYAAGLGLLRTLHAKPENRADIVPADLVINAIICAAWETSKRSPEDMKQVKIYNFVSSPENPITWSEYMHQCEINGYRTPSDKVIWHYVFRLNRYKWKHEIDKFLLHTIPAHVVDFIARCLGKPPQLVEGYKKIDRFIVVLEYFTNREFPFKNTNTQALWKGLSVEDKIRFPCSMAEFNWEKYFETYLYGGKVYLLKDTSTDYTKARRKIQLLRIAHYTVLAFVWYLLYKLVTFIYNIFC